MVKREIYSSSIPELFTRESPLAPEVISGTARGTKCAFYVKLLPGRRTERVVMITLVVSSF